MERDTENGLMITEQETTSLVLMPTMNLQLAKARLREFQEFVSEYMVEGEDFGKIPGTPKPTLYKPGADKLCELYGLSDSYTILAKVEDFDRGLFDYTIECCLSRGKQFISSGLGCCSTWESKYRFRNESRRCPNCGKEAIIKGKAEYGGGWVCFKRKDGCGQKFADNDSSIMEQVVGRVDNPDIIDQKNTALKMAKKRAKIDATLSATRSSGIFTQDIEDFKHEPSDAEFDSAMSRTSAEQREFAEKKAAAMKAEAKPTILPPETAEGGCPECGTAGGSHKWQCSIFQANRAKSAQGEKQGATHAAKPADASQGDSAPARGNSSVISPAQVKRLFAIAKEHGVTESALRDLAGKYSFEHITEITRDQYEAIVKDVESVR